METPVIRLWSFIIPLLGWLTPHKWLARMIPTDKKYVFVDLWIMLNFMISIAALLCATHSGSAPYLLTIFTWYGVMRVFEIVVYQAKVILFDPYNKKKYAVRSYRRTIVLVIHIYIEIIFWFGSFYALCKDNFKCPEILSTWVGALYYSMVTMSTLGYGEVTPSTDKGRMLVLVHLTIAIFLSLLILARFVSLLPRPKSLDRKEQDPPRKKLISIVIPLQRPLRR